MPKIKPRERIHIVLQGDDFERSRELAAEVQAAAIQAGSPSRLSDSPSVMDAAKAYDDFMAEARERGQAVPLRMLQPRGAFRKMVADHPAREGNEADESNGFHSEDFPVALVLASVVRGGDFATDRDVEEFVDSLSDADFSALYSDAYQLNEEQQRDPKVSLSSRLGQTSDETSPPPTRLG